MQYDELSNKNITLSADALFQEIGGEGVILDLNSSSYFGLDEVGTRIWQLLGEQSPLESVVEQLLAEYEVERGRLESDIADLLGDLAEAGLVRIA